MPTYDPPWVALDDEIIEHDPLTGPLNIECDDKDHDFDFTVKRSFKFTVTGHNPLFPTGVYNAMNAAAKKAHLIQEFYTPWSTGTDFQAHGAKVQTDLYAKVAADPNATCAKCDPDVPSPPGMISNGDVPCKENIFTKQILEDVLSISYRWVDNDPRTTIEVWVRIEYTVKVSLECLKLPCFSDLED